MVIWCVIEMRLIIDEPATLIILGLWDFWFQVKVKKYSRSHLSAHHQYL